MNREDIEKGIKQFPHWFHSIELAPELWTPGVFRPADRLHEMRIPDSLSGKRVLDVGACEGFYSLHCTKNGANVTAVDPYKSQQLDFVRRATEAQFSVHDHNVYQLSVEKLGSFDLILFLGVLYHLRHPLLALDILRNMMNDNGLMILESQVCDRWFIDNQGKTRRLDDFNHELSDFSIVQFYSENQLNNDPTNWWSPNEKCLEQMLSSSGFEVELVSRQKARAVFHCRKKRVDLSGVEFNVARC